MAPLVAQQAAGELDGFAGWLVDLMDRLGLVGAAIAAALDIVFPLLPSEVLLPLVGFAAAQGVFSLAAALVAVTLGSLAGGLIIYGLGRVFGRERTRWVFRRLPLLKVEDLDKAEAWFARHGKKAVFFGRMVPGIRTLISVPAGIERMNLWVFIALTTIGSLIWNSILVIAGYRLGADWHVLEPYIHGFSRTVLVVAVIAVIVFIVVRVRAKSDPMGIE